MNEKKKKKKDQKTPYDLVKGKEVTFQLVRGTIINGIYAGKHDVFFIASNAEIIGTNNICKTDLVFIHQHQIQHFHLRGEIRPKE